MLSEHVRNIMLQTIQKVQVFIAIAKEILIIPVDHEKMIFEAANPTSDASICTLPPNNIIIVRFWVTLPVSKMFKETANALQVHHVITVQIHKERFPVN